MTQLKSKAHPDWPYSGTAHEWRGFIERGDIDPCRSAFRKDPAVIRAAKAIAELRNKHRSPCQQTERIYVIDKDYEAVAEVIKALGSNDEWRGFVKSDSPRTPQAGHSSACDAGTIRHD